MVSMQHESKNVWLVVSLYLQAKSEDHKFRPGHHMSNIECDLKSKLLYALVQGPLQLYLHGAMKGNPPGVLSPQWKP